MFFGGVVTEDPTWTMVAKGDHRIVGVGWDDLVIGSKWPKPPLDFRQVRVENVWREKNISQVFFNKLSSTSLVMQTNTYP